MKVSVIAVVITAAIVGVIVFSHNRSSGSVVADQDAVADQSAHRTSAEAKAVLTRGNAETRPTMERPDRPQLDPQRPSLLLQRMVRPPKVERAWAEFKEAAHELVSDKDWEATLSIYDDWCAQRLEMNRTLFDGSTTDAEDELRIRAFAQSNSQFQQEAHLALVELLGGDTALALGGVKKSFDRGCPQNPYEWKE